MSDWGETSGTGIRQSGPPASEPIRPGLLTHLPRELLMGPSPIPAYHRLACHLQRLLDSDAVQPGEQFPPENQLAEHLHVSRPTVRQALHQLHQVNLITREHGRGTFAL